MFSLRHRPYLSPAALSNAFPQGNIRATSAPEFRVALCLTPFN